jgi:hypothetical protein
MTRLRTGAAASVAAVALLCAPGVARAAVPLKCTASMSNAHPADYSTTDVYVNTAAEAHIKTVAHYKTSTTTHRAVASAQGRASVPYKISGATPGRRVPVDVTVSLGTRTGSCSTSFTPHR